MGLNPRSAERMALSIASRRALVVGRDRDQARVGDADPGGLVDRRQDAVVIHLDVLENAEVGPARPEAAELLPEMVQGDFHLAVEIVQNVFDHRDLLLQYTVVPMSSPITARRMLPRFFRLKTMIGSVLSLQSEMAVASIT